MTATWVDRHAATVQLPELKYCTRCGEGHPPTTDHFNANPAKSDRLDSWCKGCKRQQARRRYVEGPDRERARGRARARAVAELQRRHADEWRAVYEAELESEGLA